MSENNNEICLELWQDVRLTDDEIAALCDAADLGDIETSSEIVDGAYNRLFGESEN